jgi:putative intracellular protease/amidase
VRTGFATTGNELGTGDAYDHELPRVAVLTGEGVAANSYGAHWFFLEQTIGLPFDAIPADRLGSIALEGYDVLVLPGMGRSGSVGDRQLKQVEDWVRKGGTVVAVAGGARLVAESIADIEIRERKDDAAEDITNALRGREARELDRWEQQVPGTVFSLNLDPAHPLAFGAGIDGHPDRLFALHTGGGIFEPDQSFETVAHFPEGVEKVSGVISEKNLEHLSQGAGIVLKHLGRGRVILFADDPVFRHFWYSTFQPYVNAIMVGPKL